MELVKATISFHVNLFWKTVTWTIALLSLPLRFLTALQRERLLEKHVREMRFELESLVWDRKELKDHFQAALQDLKEENLRLKEIKGKAAWSFRGGHDEPNKSKKVGKNDQVIPYGTIASLVSNSSKGSDISFQELMMNRQVWEDKSKTNGGYNIDFIKPAPAPTGSMKPFNHTIVPNIDGNGVVEERREIALSQILFSAILSLLEEEKNKK
ncbi:hypothetical protein COLO4_16514 [Corchorus olitorius]|uniref:Uncharacterized protein n=1 Tax=Corchorus olitorius TaxID=93759 RepID=A0A1R3JH40_9ROSI|nr:hypothetical protein COLO4_16514 [Corchorus olitorius]